MNDIGEVKVELYSMLKWRHFSANAVNLTSDGQLLFVFLIIPFESCEVVEIDRPKKISPNLRI